MFACLEYGYGVILLDLLKNYGVVMLSIAESFYYCHINSQSW
jgi:hypothetical protein